MINICQIIFALQDSSTAMQERTAADAKRNFLAPLRPRLAAALPGVVECFAKDILSMGGQVPLDGRRQIFIGRIRHGWRPCSVRPQANRDGRDEQQQRGHDEGEPEMVRMQLHALPFCLAARMLFTAHRHHWSEPLAVAPRRSPLARAITRSSAPWFSQSPPRIGWSPQSCPD